MLDLAEAPALSAANAANPCMRVCRMHVMTPWCLGCGRTREEIAGWFYLEDAVRAAALADLPRRRRINQQTPQERAP